MKTAEKEHQGTEEQQGRGKILQIKKVERFKVAVYS